MYYIYKLTLIILKKRSSTFTSVNMLETKEYYMTREIYFHINKKAKYGSCKICSYLQFAYKKIFWLATGGLDNSIHFILS